MILLCYKERIDMSKKILFSPVGGTDPIKYLHDGSMLHICRVYKPDVVYLYLSKEMVQNHRKDNRYVYSIEKLGELLNHKFDIHIMERNELTDVHQYDEFYKDFRGIILNIEKKMDKGDMLILNMASGTPAMKSALLVLATLAEYRFMPVQVSTPQGRMNSELEDRDNYDKEGNWELDEDNEENFKNRCCEIKCFNLMTLLKTDIIKKHVDAYDYTAAISVADEIRDDISDEAYTMLEIAAERVKLNRNRVSKLMNGVSYDLFPIKDSNKQKIFEYALVLKMKLYKEEYADFARGITPIVVDLLEMILEKQCGIKVADYCDVDKRTNMMSWNKTKLESAGLMEILNEQYKDKGGFRGGPVYSNALAALVYGKSKDDGLIKKVEEISHAESRVRNLAAHEIVSVTDDWFRNKAGKSASEIFDNIRFLIVRAGINANDEQWRSYDRMNEEIKRLL
jgi:CRISPR type III-A/MTUBE-associated protein Csm6